jgi:two-component system, NtrC family, sensor histidine kinase KinB
MPLNVKNKIWLGTLFLFLLILIVGGAGIHYIMRLKDDSSAIIKANYESIDYCHTIQKALDSISIDRNGSLKKIDIALRAQENNVTEPGELMATFHARRDFNKMQNGDSSAETAKDLEVQLQKILSLNMEAIQLKNNTAQQTAAKALSIITVLCGIVFIVAFTFSYNFPSVMVAPIRELTLGMQQISNKNYGHRIHIKNKDEFGQLAKSFNDMSERLEYFQNSNLNQILFEKARAEAVINSLKDASIGIDKNDVVLFANGQALALLGIHADQVVGKKAEVLKKSNDLFRFLMEGDNASPFKIIVGDKENYFIREVVEVSQADTQSRVIVLKNITPFKELDVAKTNFIATISHEMKTPIASVKMSLQLLENTTTGILNEEQRQLLHGIKEDCDRLLRIIAELLNLSQVETGNIQLNIKKSNPYEMLDYALESVRIQVDQKKLNLLIQKDENIPDIKADGDKTAWVLINFLTNAIRHAPERSDLNISLTKMGTLAEFSVKDQGQGIDPQYQEKIFDRYFQVPGSGKFGTGLGLAISKEFIEAQGGHIHLQSVPGEGSRFSFTLNIADA